MWAFLALISCTVAVQFLGCWNKARDKRSAQGGPGITSTGHGRTYQVANGLVAYLPERYTSMPWALPQRGRSTPNTVTAYLSNQYETIQWTPWALPQRLHDPPKIVAAYLPNQRSTIPWRLPLQVTTARSGHLISRAAVRGARLLNVQSAPLERSN